MPNGDDVPLDLSSHWQIGTGPSLAIMRAQGSARCRVQKACYPVLTTSRQALHTHSAKDVYANCMGCRWSMGSVLFLGAWGVLMGPIQYCKQASFFIYPSTHRSEVES